MNTPDGKYVMRVKPQTPSSLKRRLSNPNNAAEAKVARKKINNREDQLNDAMK